MKTREEAVELLHRYTLSPSLLKHALSVEGCMMWYARHFEVSEEEASMWGLTGLLHDFDYERYPEPTDPGGHPFEGNRILAAEGYPEVLRDAIMGHADYTGVPRVTLMAKVLFAVDELSGLITAAALVRPDRSLMNLEVSSIKKKMKDKAFARGCNREDIKKGAEELGIELDLHIANVLQALRALEGEGILVLS